MFKGLKSVIYPSSNLATDKTYWAQALGVQPYFDQPYYVGFRVGDCELGLGPNAAAEGLTYPISYWYVEDARIASEHLTSVGAAVNTELKDVGDGLMMATFKDPSGNIFGIIEQRNDVIV